MLLEGWTERAVEVGRGMPWMPVLPDAEALAVRYQRVLGRGVPAYESVFCSEDGLLGGATTERVRAAYAQIGFRHNRTDVEPDHAGVQCAALCFLYGAEADALRDGVAAEPIRSLQQHFLAQHLGCWAGLLATAVARQGVAELTALTGLLCDLVAQHAIPVAAEPEDLLADPKRGLKDVARYLSVPARCGFWLSSDDVQRIALASDLACGFGPRVKMLESLWFSAVDHQTVPLLTAVFQKELDPWDTGDARVTATRSMLTRLSEAAHPDGSAG